MKKFLTGLVVLFVLLWGGYSLFLAPEPVELEPATVLVPAQADALADLYGVAKASAELLTDRFVSASGQEFRITRPVAPGRLPVILFSHGNFSTPGEYDRLVSHWASHGYLVVEPYHLDAGGMVNGIIAMTIHGQQEVLIRRPQDMLAALDALPQIEGAIPDLAGRIDNSRIMAAGHSFGAFAAQMLGGATGTDPDTGQPLAVTDTRITAVMAISPPGPMFDMITRDSWQDMSLPQLVTTGTWDVEPRFFRDWRLHAMAHERSIANESLLLIASGADHYHGNIYGRTDRDEPPQEDAFRVLLATTTAWLDWKMRDKPGAARFLSDGFGEGIPVPFATLDHRASTAADLTDSP